MPILTVDHKTVYRYREPVRFGPHRLMFRPRDSHDLRLIDTQLQLSPPATVRWLHDVFSNSIAIAEFRAPAHTLVVRSRIRLEHFGHESPDFPVEPFARTYPFSYGVEERPDLTRTIERHYPDPDHRVDTWAKRFLHGRSTVETQALLEEINSAIRNEFDYRSRHAVGTRTPVETLEKGEGTCRDFALFMMEAVRSLGLAARFVSGYLYDPAVDGGDPSVVGAGATHAWVQVYLPGAGWVEFDPTNGLVGGANLIRVAVARDPAQALPVQGTFIGPREAYDSMQVSVEVTAKDPARPLAEDPPAASAPLTGADPLSAVRAEPVVAPGDIRPEAARSRSEPQPTAA